MKNLVFAMFLSMSIIAVDAQTCNNLHTILSPDGQHLYFTSDRDAGNYEIYKSNIDGTNLVRLTNSIDNKSFPAISPDGTKLLYQSYDYGATAEIYIMNSDGTQLSRLTNNSTYDGYPNFSPDGQSIVFSAWDSDIYPEIFTMNLDGSNRTQITNLPGADWNYAPKYNPAGTKIYYHQSYNGDNRIVMMDVNGTNQVDITPPNTYGYVDLYPSFSSDGSKIIFASSEYSGNGGILDLITTNADGTNWQRITTSSNSENFSFPCFDPTNSNKIYFSYNPSGGLNSIKTMNLDGTNLNEIAVCFNTSIASQNALSHINIYPNPANAYITILNRDGFNMDKVQIYNALGQTIYTAEPQNSKVEITTSSFSQGVYLVRIQVKDKVLSTNIRIIE